MPDRWGKYSYNDSPDGMDGHKKAWYVSKNFAKLSLFTGTVDALIISKPMSKVGVVGVYLKHMGVLVGTGLAFVCGTFIACDLRHKDDEKNHVVGALASSAVMGCAIKSPWVFAAMAVITVPAAHTLKTYHMQGAAPFELYRYVAVRPQKQLTLNWHIAEIGSPSDSLRKRYQEKNEEYYKQLDLKSPVSSDGTAV